MRSKTMSATVLACALALLPVLTASPVRADPGDRAGWSISVDPRKRAFLHYSPNAGGPRIVTIGCLADTDDFFVAVDGRIGLRTDFTVGRISLSADGVGWAGIGPVETDETTGRRLLNFRRTADAAERRSLSSDLMAVLRSPGPAGLIIGDARPYDLPLTGVSGLLDTFATVCFGDKPRKTPAGRPTAGKTSSATP